MRSNRRSHRRTRWASGASCLQSKASTDTVARLRANGAELVGEVAQYEDKYRLCYMRGPAGIIVALAEELFCAVHRLRRTGDAPMPTARPALSASDRLAVVTVAHAAVRPTEPIEHFQARRLTHARRSRATWCLLEDQGEPVASLLCYPLDVSLEGRRVQGYGIGA